MSSNTSQFQQNNNSNYQQQQSYQNQNYSNNNYPNKFNNNNNNNQGYYGKKPYSNNNYSKQNRFNNNNEQSVNTTQEKSYVSSNTNQTNETNKTGNYSNYSKKQQYTVEKEYNEQKENNQTKNNSTTNDEGMEYVTKKIDNVNIQQSKGTYNKRNNNNNNDYDDDVFDDDVGNEDCFEDEFQNCKYNEEDLGQEDYLDGDIKDDDYYDDYHREEKPFKSNNNNNNNIDYESGNPRKGNNYSDSRQNQGSQGKFQSTSGTTGYTGNTGKLIRSYNRLEFDNTFGFTDFVCKNIKDEFSKYPEITDSFVNVLMIAEKPSIAKAIAEALCEGKRVNSKPFGRGRVLLTFEGYFKNVKAKFTVSSVLGHVFTSDFKPEHNKWDSVLPVELFSVNIMKLEAMRKSHICETLGKLATGKDILALWLDCDKEGENICFEAIHCCYNSMNNRRYQQIYRAKFSSITKQDLRTAFKNISARPNRNEASSVDARQHLDLKIGIAFTRHFTSSILPALGLDEETKLLSYGPCQTPTLWFCVKRQQEIKSFVSKQVFRIFMEFVHNKSSQTIYHNLSTLKAINLSSEERKFLDNNNSKRLLEYFNSFEKSEGCFVADVIRKTQLKQPPVGLNTVSLLRTASSFLKISPHQTMVCAERLYTSGYVTYPRTETTKYASSFDFLGVLKDLSNDTSKETSSIVNQLISNFKKPALRGDDKGDHPPITPTRSGAGLTGDMKRLYDLIASHYIATLMEPAEYEEREYILEFAGEQFRASSSVITREGFLRIFSWKKDKYIRKFPDLKKGEKLEIKKISSDSYWTSPPSNLSESDLIKLMESNGIGTDASMPVHIENIVERKYVTVNGARQLIPTDLGYALISALSLIDEELVIPNIRAEIEKSVVKIAAGKSTYNDIIGSSLELYKKKFLLVCRNHEKLMKGFGRFFTMNPGKVNDALKKIRAINEKEIIKDIPKRRYV